MPLAKSTNELLEYSFFLGPEARNVILPLITLLRRNKYPMSEVDDKTKAAYVIAARSLSSEGRELIKRVAMAPCLVDERVRQDIEQNEIALKILKSFVETPLTGR